MSQPHIRHPGESRDDDEVAAGVQPNRRLPVSSRGLQAAHNSAPLRGQRLYKPPVLPEVSNFVGRLRSSSAYVPELALVAEESGRLTGHVMLTVQDIAGHSTITTTMNYAKIFTGNAHEVLEKALGF